jgi:hypothetical protein
MITKEQAMDKRNTEFHADGRKCKIWKRDGETKVWKIRPEEFMIPVQYGLYRYSRITDANSYLFHLASECPGKDNL